jgi:hypothetical protein
VGLMRRTHLVKEMLLRLRLLLFLLQLLLLL